MKRPRSSYTQTCYNCGRSGILPCSMLADDDGNRFCSTECGWSYLLSDTTVQAQRRSTVRRPTTPRTAPDEYTKLRQDCANADRVQHLLLKRLHRDKRYNAAMRSAATSRAQRGIVLPHDKVAPKPPRVTPTRHEEHALFAFSQLLGHHS